MHLVDAYLGPSPYPFPKRRGKTSYEMFLEFENYVRILDNIL